MSVRWKERWGGKGQRRQRSLHTSCPQTYQILPCTLGPVHFPLGHGAGLSASHNAFHTALAGKGQASTLPQGSAPPQPGLPSTLFCILSAVYKELSRLAPSVKGLGGPCSFLCSLSRLVQDNPFSSTLLPHSSTSGIWVLGPCL